ncbi:MAG: hypothetical protein II776_01505, partial [Clostridia bacterium]|nr:hypothetical protein [Clostridia bacterium]
MPQEFVRLPAEDRLLPEEPALLPEDPVLPRESPALPPEFAPPDAASSRTGGQTEKKSRARRIKRASLMWVAAVAAVVSVVFASYGNDPLGRDFLSTPAASAPTSPAAPVTVETADAPDEGDDAFPALANLPPDFEGKMAWSGSGSEEYIRFLLRGEGDFTYLRAGSVWVDRMGARVAPIPGASYDPSKNTLTLENFSAALLDVNLMGNGF